MTILDLKEQYPIESQLFYIDNSDILKSHPVDTDRHDLYGAAHCMVSERHNKEDITLLVNHLLHLLYDAD